MEVLFLGPHTNKILPVDLDGVITAGEAIAGLVDERFLAPPNGRPYALVVARTGKTMLPEERLDAVDVREGDHLQVVQANNGASRGRM